MQRSWLTNLLVTGLWLLTAVAGASEADRPNILFVFADDMCFQTVAAFGHEDIETPHLDRLAQRGATFTHAYNMGGWHGAICIASRTMLNTGRTLWRAEAIDKTCEAERQAGRFWSEHLKRAGYRTYFTGKWHIQAKVQAAFDVVQDVRPGMPATVEASYNRPLEGMPDLWDSADPALGGYWVNGKHLSEITADVAISFLREAQSQPDPFFMYVAFNAPHDPRQAPQEFLDRYPVDSQSVPLNFIPEYPEKHGIGCDPKLRDEKLLPFPRTPSAVQVHRREYFAMITHLDEQIGRIMAALEASGKARNTWVVFTADHGLAVGQHGLVGKQNMYDHSVRVPFIVVGPEVQSGQRISTPIYLQSVLPTTLELAGCEVPEHVEYPSLLPWLRGTAPPADQPICGAYMNLQRMVTVGEYKLILYPELKVWKLFHVAEDPLERHNLAGETAALGRARQLFAQLQDLQTRYADPLDLTIRFPELVSSASVRP